MTTGSVPYWRMSGLGNEILILDLRATSIVLDATTVVALAARPAFAFDQLMALHKPATPGSDAAIVIYNADGSEAGACGNGMRCVAYVEHVRAGKPELLFETVAGLLPAVVRDITRIAVGMGQPRFGWADIPLATAVSDTLHVDLDLGVPAVRAPAVVNVGNPHAIFWVDDVTAHDLARLGPQVEHHPLFPHRVNVSLAQVTSERTLRLRTWERGAGLTQACGSAACAATVCAHRLRLTGRDVTVSLPGGDLAISWRPDDRIVMTGPVTVHHAGTLDLADRRETIG